MGEIGNTFSGLSGKTKEDFGHGQASFVTYLNVFNNSIGQPNMIEKVEIDPKQFQVKQGDILFTTSSETPDEVGMACVWPVNLPNLYLNSFCFGFRPKKEIDINFYAHMLRSPQVRNQITLLAQGISRYNISKTKMMDIRIWLPSESEQRRIGRFLGNIDNLITLHQRKSVTIKKLKSGLLRKMILTVESTLTDVFLPLFTIDWEQRKLGEIGNTFSGLSGKTKEDFGHGQASFVTYLNVFNNSIGQPNMIEKVEIDPKQFQVKQGDILFTTSSETPDEVGMACVWPVNLPNLYLNSFCFGFRPKKEIDINFYAHMLRSPQVRNQITLLAQGISRYNISKTKMMDIRIWLPSESEQRRIGRFLGNIDNLITLHQRKSVTIKKLKSGLLRKMILTVESTLTDVFLPLFTIDWEQRKLGELAEIVSGGTPATSNPEYWDGTINWYTPAEISEARYVYGSQKKITEVGLNNSSAKILPKDRTILFTSRAGIGKTAILKNDASTNQGFQSIVVKNNIDPEFVYSMSTQIKEKAERVAAGSTFSEISGKQLGKIILMIPGIKEQQRIGELFSIIDNLITLHQRKLFIISYIK